MSCSKADCGDVCVCGHCSGQHESYDQACDVCTCDEFEEPREKGK